MSGAASTLFLLDIKGRVLVWRDYRGDVTALQAEKMFTKLIEKEVFKHYFEELEEESLRDNFVVVYELLDEMMDFGYPQFTETKILSEFIKTDAYRMEVTQMPPMAVTNAVSWRSEGIRYKKNEVFLDVVESVNILVNNNGQIIRSEVVGALKMRTYLSGMPECKLGLNDIVLLEAQGRSSKGKAIDLDDIKFHQTIAFIPPDGCFDLMTYRLSTRERSTATNIEIELPVPSDATNPNLRTSMGTATYAPEKDALMWKIKAFPGGKEYMMRAESCHRYEWWPWGLNSGFLPTNIKDFTTMLHISLTLKTYLHTI
ncbi:AP-1 complex subunit mu-2 [Ranunculus cassubicifolius]